MTPLGEVRTAFPVLSTCTYLNSNSTGAVPRGVEAVLQGYWETLRNWRDEVWEDWWREFHRYPDEIAALIGAPPGSVVTDANVSTLLGRLATCFDYRGERRRIVVTDLEFPSIPFIWEGFARYGAELVVVPSDGRDFDEERLTAAIDERTLLVCVSHASFATGALLDIASIARHAHAAGALVIADAYQTVGAMPVDVGELDVDFLLGGAHKWLCGSIESAFLYIRPSLLPAMRPAATGWMAGETPLTFERPTGWAPTARRLASGTPAILPGLISRVGLDLIKQVSPSVIRLHSLICTTAIIEAADTMGLTVVTPRPAARRGGIVSLR